MALQFEVELREGVDAVLRGAHLPPVHGGVADDDGARPAGFNTRAISVYAATMSASYKLILSPPLPRTPMNSSRIFAKSYPIASNECASFST